MIGVKKFLQTKNETSFGGSEFDGIRRSNGGALDFVWFGVG